MSYIRDFGRYLRAHGDRNAYVLTDRWKASFVPAHPYLMTGHEIEAFFSSAAQLEVSWPYVFKWGLRVLIRGGDGRLGQLTPPV